MYSMSIMLINYCSSTSTINISTSTQLWWSFVMKLANLVLKIVLIVTKMWLNVEALVIKVIAYYILLMCRQKSKNYEHSMATVGT